MKELLTGQEISFIVGIVDSSMRLHMFAIDSTIMVPDDSFGFDVAIGSGTDFAIKDIPSAHVKLIPGFGEFNELEKATAHGICWQSMLLEQEIYTQETLLNYFGGAYEICSVVGGVPQKIGDITRMLWIADVTNGCKPEDIIINDPSLLIKTAYINDFLVVESLKRTQIQEPPYKRSTHLIGPIDRVISNVEVNYTKELLPTIGFNSTWTCHSILMIRHERPILILKQIAHNLMNSNLSIKVECEQEETVFVIPQEWIKEVILKCSSALRDNNL